MTNLTNTNLETLTATDLKKLAKEFKVKNWWNLKKADLITELTNIQLDLQDQEAVKKANEEYQEELQKQTTSKTEMVSLPGTDSSNPEEKAAGKAPEKKTTKKPKSQKTEKNEDNLVTIKELAAEFHMKGTKARRLLRNETAARPFGGNRWEWDMKLHAKELELARNILKAHTK